MMFSTVCCGCSSCLHPATLGGSGNSRCTSERVHASGTGCARCCGGRATAASARDGPGAPGYLPPAAAVWDSWGRARSYGTLLLRGNCCWRRRVGGCRSHSRVHHLRSIQVPARVDRRSKPRQCWARTSPLGPGHESPSAVDRTSFPSVTVETRAHAALARKQHGSVLVRDSARPVLEGPSDGIETRGTARPSGPHADRRPSELRAELTVVFDHRPPGVSPGRHGARRRSSSAGDSSGSPIGSRHR